jgi:hypothetical protein
MFYVNGVSLNVDAKMREISMFQVSRAAFDLIPGIERHYRSDVSGREYWLKNTTIGLGHNKLLLTVYCDEPPAQSCPSA